MTSVFGELDRKPPSHKRSSWWALHPHTAVPVPLADGGSLISGSLSSVSCSKPASCVCVCYEQVTSPQRIPATVAPSLLMSPMVFTQSTSAPPKDRAGRLLPQGSQALSPASSSLLLPPQSPEPTAATSIPLTKLQLQEALLHLVQNDDSFLNIIYEAYLFSMTQAAVRETV